MPTRRTTTKVRALRDLALRKSPDPSSPEWGEWYEWSAGDEFEPPAHMKTALMLANGKIEEA